MTFKRCVDDQAATNPLEFFMVHGSSHTYHGRTENHRRQIVIAAREMERKVGQGHSYDLRISFACFLDL